MERGALSPDPTSHGPVPAARVAIVVTCFDDGETLGETVASIRSGAPTAELVIVDDGSGDELTLRVLGQLEEDGVRVIHQVNGGPAAAGMAGVEATSAPYVMRFDADDLLEPGAADALADALDRAHGAVAAWGDIQTFGVSTFRIHGVHAMDAWLITYTNCITGAGTLLRREALIEAGGWQIREGWEDWDLWMALTERGHEGIYVPRDVFRYRRDRGGRHAESLANAENHYAELRRRHPVLFAGRAENRKRSKAPRALKILVSAAESVPGIPRLTRIHLCEFLTRLFLGAGVRATAPMLWQAVKLRLGPAD